MNPFSFWWKNLLYAPGDPEYLAGGKIKIAAIGGGTGLATLLRGLKNYSDEISAIVAVTDNGKSSGVLRKEYDILPPGDIRKCISALSYNEGFVSEIFEFRFDEKRKPFSGHSLGNIWITALTKYFGSFEKALQATTETFRTAGNILPATFEKINIVAEYANGKHVKGEEKIPKVGRRIVNLSLDKTGVRANKQAVLAILNADLIILGPGSLYTSLIPNLLIRGIKKAILANRDASKVFICNCSTEKGETENYSVQDHINEIQKYSNNAFDFCLVNSKVIKKTSYGEKIGEVNNITLKKGQIISLNAILDDVIDDRNPLFHNSEKLAKTLIKFYNKSKGR